MNSDFRNGVWTGLAGVILAWLSAGLLGKALRHGEIIQVPQYIVLPLDYLFVVLAGIFALLSLNYSRKFFVRWFDWLSSWADWAN